MKSFSITTPKGERKIGLGEPCFVIAELSGNHHQNFNKALEMIRAAAAAGADAIKIQTYTPDTLTIDSDEEWFVVKNKDNPELWKGQKLYDLYKTAYTPWEWTGDLKKVAEELGLVFFSTAYDETAVDFLEQFDVPCYKIASYEATDLITLRRVAATRKPVVLSTGFAQSNEIDWAVTTLKKHGASNIALLHCVTAYSDTPRINQVNLRTMLDLRDYYDVVCGFSDNNTGIEIPLTAAIAGAAIIEKHFIMNRSEGGTDARFSLEPAELKELVTKIRDAETMLGTVRYGCQSEQEKQNTFFRRSLFVVANIKQGEKFNSDNIRSIRPSSGLETKYYDEILGKVATCDIVRGTPLQWNLIAK